MSHCSRNDDHKDKLGGKHKALTMETCHLVLSSIVLESTWRPIRKRWLVTKEQLAFPTRWPPLKNPPWNSINCHLLCAGYLFAMNQNSKRKLQIMQDSLWCRNDCEVENIFNRHHCRPIRPISSVKVIAREGGFECNR
jgi:hypothetical protein